MASPRITQSMREQITNNALLHRFTDDVNKMSVTMSKLAEQAYHFVFSPDDIKAMEHLGESVLTMSGSIVVRMAGEIRTMDFDGYLIRNHTGTALRFGGTVFPNKLQADIVELLMPFTDRYSRQNEAYWTRFTIKRDSKAKSKFCDDVLAAEADEEKLKSAIDEASTKLMSLLESVQTFKKLRAIWPEGAQFYDQYDVDHTLTPKVPAVIITDINKSLGI